MENFKQWMNAQNSTNAGFSAGTVTGLQNAEQEHDPYVPDQAHILLASKFANRIKGFFPTFRQSIKSRVILNAFSQILSKLKGNPFDYNNPSWLNDELEQAIAQQVGLTPDQFSHYSEPLKRYFVQIYNNSRSWNHNQQTQSWPKN